MGADATRTGTKEAIDGTPVAPPLMRVDAMAVTYGRGPGGGGRAVEATFELRTGQAVGVVGGSGSGKTTLVRAVAGLLPRGAQVSGRITLDGTDLTVLSAAKRQALLGRRIGYVGQNALSALHPAMTIGRQVEEAVAAHDRTDRRSRRRRSLELLAAVGLDDPHRRHRQRAHELSGGMRQRVAIAMAVAHEPDLLILDECTSALDAVVQHQILALIADIRARSASTVLLVSHDLAVVAAVADRVLVLDDGRVVEEGPVGAVLAQPRHLASRALVDAGPVWPPPATPATLTAPLDRSPAPAGSANDDGHGHAPGVLAVSGLVKRFGPHGPAVLNDVGFQLAGGETLGVVGPSGCGKSTLLRVIAGLTGRDGGRGTIGGEPLFGGNRSAVRQRRRRIQMVFQDPYGSLDPRRSVRHIVAEPLRIHGLGPVEETVTAALDAVGLAHDLWGRRAHQLSGGQQQRVGIARALVLGPDVLLLDEPVSALDAAVRADIVDLLARLQDERGLAYVFVSHDLAVVAQLADRVAVMDEGRLVEIGETGAVIDTPQHPRTRKLVEAVLTLPATHHGPDLVRRRRITPRL